MQFRQQVAQGWCFFPFAYAQHGVMRGFHLIVWHNHTAHAILTRLDGIYRGTFFVEQIGCDRHRNNSVNFLRIFFQRFFFDQTQNRQRQ